MPRRIKLTAVIQNHLGLLRRMQVTAVTIVNSHLLEPYRRSLHAVAVEALEASEVPLKPPEEAFVTN